MLQIWWFQCLCGACQQQHSNVSYFSCQCIEMMLWRCFIQTIVFGLKCPVLSYNDSIKKNKNTINYSRTSNLSFATRKSNKNGLRINVRRQTKVEERGLLLEQICATKFWNLQRRTEILHGLNLGESKIGHCCMGSLGKVKHLKADHSRRGILVSELECWKVHESSTCISFYI